MRGIELMDEVHPVSANPFTELPHRVPEARTGFTILAFSGDMDRLLAVFTLATSAAAMGTPVTIFFAFWGLAALKRQTTFKGKGFLGAVLTAMLPSGPESLGLSRWNMLGLGRRFFGVVMRRNRMETLRGLIDLAREMKVRLVACQTSMGALAIAREELLEGVETGGAATFLEAAQSSATTIFV